MKSLFLMVLLVVGPTAWADELTEAKAEFAKQDKALNETYAALKKELEPELFRKLQDDQRAWVEYRDYISDWQAGQANPEESAAKWEMATGLTEARVEWLAAWRNIGRSKGWEGRYSDSQGGLLRIAEKDGKHWFSLTVVRGPTFHLGDIGGEFRVNGGTGWFEVTGEGAEGPTWLTFLQEQDGTGRLRIIGENAQYFHGARAYFDGSYLWMGELTAEEQIEVMEGEAE